MKLRFCFCQVVNTTILERNRVPDRRKNVCCLFGIFDYISGMHGNVYAKF